MPGRLIFEIKVFKILPEILCKYFELIFKILCGVGFLKSIPKYFLKVFSTLQI